MTSAFGGSSGTAKLLNLLAISRRYCRVPSLSIAGRRSRLCQICAPLQDGLVASVTKPQQ